jgi:hypothetical protein
MTYSKPEVIPIGKATRVIEQTGAKPYANSADGGFGQNPAYDLDE